MKIWQQGDILIIETKKQGTKKILKSTEGYVIARGEATGHRHRILEDIDLYENHILVAGLPFTIIHEEHQPITVPAGIYEVRHVREYDHFDEEARAVVD